MVIVLLGWGKKVCFSSFLMPAGRFSEDTDLLCFDDGELRRVCAYAALLFVNIAFDLHLHFLSGIDNI